MQPFCCGFLNGSLNGDPFSNGIKHQRSAAHVCTCNFEGFTLIVHGLGNEMIHLGPVVFFGWYGLRGKGAQKATTLWNVG